MYKILTLQKTHPFLRRNHMHQVNMTQDFSLIKYGHHKLKDELKGIIRILFLSNMIY